MRESELPAWEAVWAELSRDPVVAAELERTALAHGVAMAVLRYRTERGFTQAELAQMLGMHQPAVARLEASDQQPSYATLERLARVLGMEFHLSITPASPHVQLELVRVPDAAQDARRAG